MNTSHEQDPSQKTPGPLITISEDKLTTTEAKNYNSEQQPRSTNPQDSPIPTANYLSINSSPNPPATPQPINEIVLNGHNVLLSVITELYNMLSMQGQILTAYQENNLDLLQSLEENYMKPLTKDIGGT
jgi:hypothetical protein